MSTNSHKNCLCWVGYFVMGSKSEEEEDDSRYRPNPRSSKILERESPTGSKAKLLVTRPPVLHDTGTAQRTRNWSLFSPLYRDLVPVIRFCVVGRETGDKDVLIWGHFWRKGTKIDSPSTDRIEPETLIEVPEQRGDLGEAQSGAGPSQRSSQLREGETTVP